jgi:hypothetical protein
MHFGTFPLVAKQAPVTGGIALNVLVHDAGANREKPAPKIGEDFETIIAPNLTGRSAPRALPDGSMDLGAAREAIIGELDRRAALGDFTAQPMRNRRKSA